MAYKLHEVLSLNVPWLSAAGVAAVSVPDGSFTGDVTITFWVEIEELIVLEVFDIVFITGIAIQLRSFGASVA
ncbi:hypothetical protein N7481_008593 [Penicillium waksmanii]|uniref:uncharacterized protein n=1 Tax=Penicillium waksmanii TaxID=69791 RepID=UPI00254883DF|nr:uncharacterized protein N7481_008593 [Penicillium waksmanii]KAJ5974886.1 hypothetical protein N7481_008593 [Penicillium waksmanii]